VAAARGMPLLAHLSEMRGERGSPQPGRWTLLFADPAARGGVREIVVQDGAILSERTPLGGFAGIADRPRIDTSVLKLDSDAIFKIAEKEAVRREVGFYWIDYSLNGVGHAPGTVWEIRLLDHMGAPVGSLEISAVDGGIVRPLEIDSSAADATTRPRQAGKPMGGFIGKVENMTKTTTEKVGDKVSTTARKAGDIAVKTSKKVTDKTLDVVGSVQEFFTGQRTVGAHKD